MSDSVYKLIEITGTSTTGYDDAVRTAIAKASESVRNLRWFEVVETRGAIEDDKISQWQVTLKVGFNLDDDV